MKIVGYGIVGPGEADRYMRGTLEEFKRLCDETILLLNNVSDKEREMIAEYGFKTVDDDRIWGENQHRIKQDFVENHVSKLRPTHCVCLDMDEQFDPEMGKEELIQWFETGHALYFYILNLWEKGWNRRWSFWNVRAWTWNGDTKFENRPLHCGLAPAWCYRYGSYAPVFVEHHGLKTKESRQRKVERYEKFDPKAKYKDRSYYEALKSDAYDELDYDFVRREIIREVGTQKKRRMAKVDVQDYYYIEMDGRQIDIPGKQLQEHIQRGWKVVGKVGEVPDGNEKTKIAFIGKFERLWDEEYIARSFEEIGCDVLRIPEHMDGGRLLSKIFAYSPDLVLFTKLNHRSDHAIVEALKVRGIKTAAWIFDLYWGYHRENRITHDACFTADYVFTTDGGNDDKWKEAGINHITVRQGIFDPECYAKKDDKEHDIVFVGCNNPYNRERNDKIDRLKQDFKVHWVGERDTNELRSTGLNDLYAKTKIVVGDSVYSPNYWSNRVVETLGRGGFLIHRDVPGIKDVYPDLVTYDGTYEDLKKKVTYYLKQNKRREDIIKKNLDHVKENYLCSEMCAEILNAIK